MRSIVNMEKWAKIILSCGLRYYIIDLQELPKIYYLSMNHCLHDLRILAMLEAKSLNMQPNFGVNRTNGWGASLAQVKHK